VVFREALAGEAGATFRHPKPAEREGSRGTPN
jgi:hypothetical protein